MPRLPVAGERTDPAALARRARHVVVFQLEGLHLFDRIRTWPRPLAVPAALLAMAATPMVLYPLGLLALGVALVAGPPAAPALAVSGLLVLSPLIAIAVIALMVVVGRHKGG